MYVPQGVDLIMKLSFLVPNVWTLEEAGEVYILHYSCHFIKLHYDIPKFNEIPG